MNENSARIVSFVRTIETAPAGAEIWSPADAAWASRVAEQEVGSDASPEKFIQSRAGVAWRKLADRRPELGRHFRKLHSRTWPGLVLAAIALVCGLLVDQIGPSKRINLLALPLLGMLAWNLGVYLWIVTRPIRRLFFRGQGRRGWMERLLTGASAAGSLPREGGTDTLPGNCRSAWARLSRPLAAAQAARAWHLAAALFAIGIVVSLYFRGLYLDYRAGWESTFLAAEPVHRILWLAVGWLPEKFGMPFPNADAIGQLQFDAGNASGDGAPWIHRMAMTSFALVILPRLCLAAYSALREYMLRRSFPIDLGEPYFRKLTLAYRRTEMNAMVVPYASSPSPQAAIGLKEILQGVWSPSSKLNFAESVAFGGEDDSSAIGRGDEIHLYIMLFNLASTPEEENHGVFVRAMKARCRDGQELAALVDDHAFRVRFGDQNERLAERRKLWEDFLGELAVPCIVCDLSRPDITALSAEFERKLARSPGGRA